MSADEQTLVVVVYAYVGEFDVEFVTVRQVFMQR